MTTLLEKKKQLIERFGYILMERKATWVCYDPKTQIGGFWHECESMEQAIESGFLKVSAAIYDGILYGQLTPAQAGEYFLSVDQPKSPHPARLIP